MKKLTSIIAALVVVILAAGCLTKSAVVTTNPAGSKTTNSVHAVDQRVQDNIETGKAIAPLLPQPVGWISAFGLALAGAIGQSYASYKNKQEAIAQSKEAFKWEDVATTIIQGVDAVGTEAKKVKDAIKARSITDGNHDLVRDIVAEETKKVS